MWENIKISWQKRHFLFKELVKRDFKKKYKRTVLGILWSMLSPLMMLGVISFVFSRFFAHSIDYYIPYVLAGQIVFSYFSEATNAGMAALLTNASIFSKINVPKHLFILSKNVSAFINFLLTVVIFFSFVFAYGIKPSISMIHIVVPIVCLIIFNYGVGLVLSALYVFFRDIQYLYGIILQVVMYGSAIFYSADGFTGLMHDIFYLNPLYIYITLIRQTVIYNTVPDMLLWILAVMYAVLSLALGHWVYHRYNYQFIYYI